MTKAPTVDLLSRLLRNFSRTAAKARDCSTTGSGMRQAFRRVGVWTECIESLDGFRYQKASVGGILVAMSEKCRKESDFDSQDFMELAMVLVIDPKEMDFLDSNSFDRAFLFVTETARGSVRPNSVTTEEAKHDFEPANSLRLFLFCPLFSDCTATALAK